MDLTTLARVKARLGKVSSEDTADDANLGSLIQGVSRRIERYLDRELKRVARTEYLNVRQWRTAYPLRAYPIDSVASVHLDPEGAFGSDTLLLATDYVIDDEVGQIVLRSTPLADAPRALKVVYTGGIADDVDELVDDDAWRDIVLAADREVVAEFKRIGAELIQSTTHQGGTTSYVEDGFLRGTMGILDRHRRMGV